MAEEARKRQKNPLGLWLGIGLVLAGLLAVGSGIRSLLDNKTRLVAPNGVITIEIVDTPEARRMGLSGRPSIADDAGMLFVFDDPNAGNCFWMKDMQFSIDMIWLNEDKEVVTVTPNVTPETYPQSFCPSTPASYGLEIGDGRAAALEINEGSRLRF